jgi:hypothetical protein
MCEKHYAELTNAKSLAQLKDPANPHLSLGDHARFLSGSGKLAHEYLGNTPRAVRTTTEAAPIPGPHYRTLLQLRAGVGLSIQRKGNRQCACDKVEFTPEHALGCVEMGFLTRRHEALITVLHALARECGLAASRTFLKFTYPPREADQLQPGEKAHYIPDLLIYDYPHAGEVLVCDVSVTTPSGTVAESMHRGTAAYARHKEKEKKVSEHLEHTLAETAQGAPPHHTFVPIIFEAYGASTRAVSDLVKGLCQMRTDTIGTGGPDAAIFMHSWKHRISSVLQLANARQLHHLAQDVPDSRKYTTGYMPQTDHGPPRQPP